jgi:hypothetical protein
MGVDLRIAWEVLGSYGSAFLIICIQESEVFGSEAGMLGYSGQDRMAKFFVVMESKHVTAAAG